MKKSTAKIPIETKCLHCGKKITETLGRFKKKPEPTCPKCGGKLDLQPLRDLALAVVKDLQSVLKADKDKG